MRINHRKLNRLKNKLWKRYAKMNGIVERIKSHLKNDRDFLMYKKFQRKWYVWKQWHSDSRFPNKQARLCSILNDPEINLICREVGI